MKIENIMLLIGFTVTLVTVVVCIILLKKEEKRKKIKSQEHDNYPTTLTSSEAMDRDSDLDYEFSRLVSEISYYQARLAGKTVTYAEAKAGVPDEKLISPKDIDAAFLEAIKELHIEISIVSSSCCYNSCDEKSLLEKIKKLREKYENKTL